MITKTACAKQFFDGEDTYPIAWRIYGKHGGSHDAWILWVEDAIRQYIKSGKRWLDYQEEINK